MEEEETIPATKAQRGLAWDFCVYEAMMWSSELYGKEFICTIK